jgi:hypothetical protein
MTAHLISRVTILGTGLIGGSFAKALRKYTSDMHISGWDRPDVARVAQSSGAFDDASTGDLAPALRTADLIFIALPIGVTLDLLPEIARAAPRRHHRCLQHQAAHRASRGRTVLGPACAAVSRWASHGGQGGCRHGAR